MERVHNAGVIICSCLQFLRLGFEGYKKIMTNLMEVSAHLAKGILATGTPLLHCLVA